MLVMTNIFHMSTPPWELIWTAIYLFSRLVQEILMTD